MMPTEGTNTLIGGYYDNLQTNLLVQNTQQNRQRSIEIVNPTFGDLAQWNVEMSVTFTYTLSGAYGLPYYQVADWHLLFETTDSIGVDSYATYNGERLYFEEQGKDFAFGERLINFPNEIRYEPDGVTFATGESLNARGLYVGVIPLPTGVQYHLPKVRGVLVA
jgi:hypothetical protein